MKKKFSSILLIALLCFPFKLFAEKGPIESGGWHWKEGIYLNGNLFFDVAPSYNEQDGWAYINGIGKLHYWLYDTYSFHNGDGSKIVDKFVPHWIEEMGYVIDFDNITEVSPNNDLASSVKALMNQRGCDVSVTLFDGSVIINNYDEDDDIYWTMVIPLIE